MNEKKGTTTENLKFREKPSINATPYSYQTKDGKDIPFLVKGTKVIVLYRTEEKQHVKEWYNYWYYVRLEQVDDNILFYLTKDDGSNVHVDCEAWCFGEFINIE